MNNNKICVCMLVCGSALDYGKYAIQINKQYCEKHNYDFFVEYNQLDSNKHPAWSKILLIQNLTKLNYKHIFYIDADACFVNYNIKIEDFINEKSITIANENKNFNEPRGQNSGVMLFNNNHITKEFLNDCWNIYQECKYSCVWDQQAIGKMLDSKYKHHHKKLTCKQFNAYYGNFAQNLNKPYCLYEDGCFIIHMLRTSSDYKIQKFKEIINNLNKNTQ